MSAGLAETFRIFAQREALLTSPLYAALAHAVAGDDDLPALLDGLPPGEAACAFHAFTFNQIPAPLADCFVAALAQASHRRPVFRLAYEWGEGDAPELLLTAFAGGEATAPRRLATAEAHGRWIDWAV